MRSLSLGRLFRSRSLTQRAIYAGFIALGLLELVAGAAPGQGREEAPLTRAARSEYRATASHADVVTFCETLAAQSDWVEFKPFGQSAQGRSLPLLIISSEAVSSAEDARRLGKTVVLCLGGIHPGEVCGKEALLMLARDLVCEPDVAPLKNIVLLIAPLYNADGNERVSPDNRRHQPGPDGGVGERKTSEGYDLNRDFVKLEAPESRALLRLIREWDPDIVIDTHTTNGSLHRYTLTYDSPRHPATPKSIQDFLRDTYLPEIRRAVKEQSGYDTFYYGNFEANHTRWAAYPGLPRYSTHYFGIRNRIAILTEAYVYASYLDRVQATYAFVKECLRSADRHRKEIQTLTREADAMTVRSGNEGKGTIPLQTRLAPWPHEVTIKGFVELTGLDPAKAEPEEHRDYSVAHWGTAEVVKEAKVPYAYALPEDFPDVTKTLQRHGIEIEELREDIKLKVQTYTVQTVLEPGERTKNQTRIAVTAARMNESVWLKAGTRMIYTGQPLGRLAAFLLEPESEDGVVVWNIFDKALQPGKAYPVLRVENPVWLLTAPVEPLAEDRMSGRRITYDPSNGGTAVDLDGSPTGVVGWHPEGKRYLQVRDEQLTSVSVRAGRATPLFDRDRLSQALEGLPSFSSTDAASVSRRTRYNFNPDQTGAWLEHENDLYFLRFDGSEVKRLTATPEREELPSFSPDGKFMAFVRESNLFVVDLATQTERALTTNGSGVIRNGKADWIYYEELFDRNWKAYWWSPDSRRLAFLRFDASALPTFNALNTLPLHGEIESLRHPKVGDPNPEVRLGIVSVGGNTPQWADLAAYSTGSYVIPEVGWYPDSRRVFCYVQNRIQTWLDYLVWTPNRGSPQRLFRDSTDAWIMSPGPPHFLEDGKFLILSDRTGWNHLYLFNPKDEAWKAITSGDWEIRLVQFVDRDKGWVYFTATRDSPIAENLYRCRLNGTKLQRLTRGDGHHRINFNPSGKTYVDTWSTYHTPSQVALYHSNGRKIRQLDSNPVPELKEFDLGDSRLMQIESRDGFAFEAAMTKPPDFSPDRRYPVWFMTYGGPDAPSIRDAWQGGHVRDHMLASLGLVVFRMDPRSASGKGSRSAWTAYRQLGVQELKDITEAIEWLKRQPYVDPTRIGMSGHSYGGFLTAYALTHSDLFAAGIAGAPVTDWRYYDSIYTERYMDLPENNATGYARSSVVEAAPNLRGRLLLLHGMMDDNVHLQNATQLIHAFQEANVDFQMMFYPTMKHGLYGDHYQRLLVDFIRDALRLDFDPASP